MAKKKYQNMKLEQNELTPVAIGSLGNKRKNPIGGFLIITLFILAIVFLPEISDYVSKLLNQTPVAPLNPNNPTPNNPTDPEEPTEDVVFYEFTKELKIEKNDILVSDFLVDTVKSVLSYTVTNPLNSTQNTEKLNYYLEVYDKNKVLLERVKLANENSLSSGTSEALEKNILEQTALNIGYVTLIKKNISDYPAVTLKQNEENISTLICTRKTEKVSYKFQSSLLKEVSHEFSYDDTNYDYQDMYTKMKESSNSYQNKAGITSTFFDNYSNFNIATTVDLNNAYRTYIFNADTFKLDTEPKVVKFEMEAQNFSCIEG